MGLRSLRFVDLPEHHAPGGFDHAAVHGGKNLLYVAHTANDAVDVIDCASGQFLRSVPGLTGAAGALVSEERDLVFTSNRGEDMVSVFAPGNEQGRFKVPVGVRPNGLSFDPRRGLLLAANVGSPDEAGSFYALRGGHHAPEDDPLNPRPGTDALDSIRSSRGPLLRQYRRPAPDPGGGGGAS